MGHSSSTPGDATAGLGLMSIATFTADPKHPVIKVEDLMETVALLRREDGEGFTDEFQVQSIGWNSVMMTVYNFLSIL